jgi:hypothetical protein
MCLRLLKSLVIYGILILYVLMPIFDSMVCADCSSGAPFQRQTTDHLQASHGDVIYPSHDGEQSRTSDEQTAVSFCELCADFVLDVDVFASHVHLSITRWDGICDLSALSNPFNSIYKPPQNYLV